MEVVGASESFWESLHAELRGAGRRSEVVGQRHHFDGWKLSKSMQEGLRLERGCEWSVGGGEMCCGHEQRRISDVYAGGVYV